MRASFTKQSIFIAIALAQCVCSSYAGCAGGGGSMKGYTPPSPSAAEGLNLLNMTTTPPPGSVAATKPANPAVAPTPAPNTPSTANPIPKTTTIANTPSSEPTIAGKVVWTKGTLKVVGADKKIRVLQPGSPIYPEDTIVTDGKSQAEVVFTDHTIVTFNKNTVFNVTKYDYHPEVKSGSVGSYIMNLIVGSYRTVTGKIAKTNPSDYQVNTDVAVMGVRGTDYGASFGSCRVNMKYYSGTPILTNSKGTLTLTQAAPYGEVNGANSPPITVKVEPSVFKNNLPIVSASVETIKTMPPLKIFNNKPANGGGGGGSDACGPGASGGGFNVKYH